MTRLVAPAVSAALLAIGTALITWATRSTRQIRKENRP